MLLANCPIMLCKKKSQKLCDQIILLVFSLVLEHLILPTANECEFIMVSKMWSSLKRDCKTESDNMGLTFPGEQTSYDLLKGRA